MTIQNLSIMVGDTETVGLEGLGYCIANKRGNIVAERNWLVEENFTNPKKMMGAFYAGKHFSHYARMLQDGKIRLTPWAEVIETLRDDWETYDCNVFAAYNAGFDLRVIQQTHEDLGFEGDALPDAKILDIWQFACETKLSQKQYANIARSQGWVSSKGNIKTGAEFAHRYCSGDLSFIEDHTALSDARIEVAILAECFKQKRRVPYGITNAQPWRIVNKKARGDDPDIHGSKVA